MADVGCILHTLYALYTDVDECIDNLGGCSEFANCTNVPDSFICSCNPGYIGDGFTCLGIFIPSVVLVTSSE